MTSEKYENDNDETLYPNMVGATSNGIFLRILE